MLREDQNCRETETGGEGGNKVEEQIKEGINERDGVPPSKCVELWQTFRAASLRDGQQNTDAL